MSSRIQQQKALQKRPLYPPSPPPGIMQKLWSWKVKFDCTMAFSVMSPGEKLIIGMWWHAGQSTWSSWDLSAYTCSDTFLTNSPMPLEDSPTMFMGKRLASLSLTWAKNSVALPGLIKVKVFAFEPYEGLDSTPRQQGYRDPLDDTLSVQKG
nr:hypothetical protein L204_04111 [Cryptococcus depauperatus CBS 7855]